MDSSEQEAAQGLARTVLGICPEAHFVTIDGIVVGVREVSYEEEADHD